MARGLVEGIANDRSPLSNDGTIEPTLDPINLSAIWFLPRHKLKLKWDTVSGVDRYLIHVYEFRGDVRGVDEIILSGTYSPIYDGASHDLFVGYAPANVDFMFVGDSTRSDIETLTLRPTFYGQEYLVRMTGLDANGNIVARTPGSIVAVSGLDGEGTYGVFSLGSISAIDTVEAPTGAGLQTRELAARLGARTWAVPSRDIAAHRSRLGRLLR